MFGDTGSGVGTQIIKGSHFIDPLVREWEMVRASNNDNDKEYINTLVGERSDMAKLICRGR